MKQSNYYRRITELLPKVIKKNLGLSKHHGKKIKEHAKAVLVSRKHVKTGILRYSFLFLLLLFFLLSYLLINLYDAYTKTISSHNQSVEKLSYWENILKKHPNYVDVYYSAALEAIKLKENNKAVDFLEKALFYDPLFKEAEELKKSLIK